MPIGGGGQGLDSVLAALDPVVLLLQETGGCLQVQRTVDADKGKHGVGGKGDDPVADKLIVMISLVLLTANPVIAEQVYDIRLFTIVVLIIIGREIGVSALREWMAQVGKHAVVKVSWVGKWKTAIQMVATAILLYGQPFINLPLMTIGEILLYITAVLTLWSMIVYMIAAWPALTSSSSE